MKSSDDPMHQLLVRVLYHFGKCVRRRRMNMKLTQEEFCKVSGISISELKFVEAGDRNVTLGTTLRICLSLEGCSIGEIMCETSTRMLEDEQGLFLWRSVLRTLRGSIKSVSRLRRRSSE